jgi:hypothetical protein
MIYVMAQIDLAREGTQRSLEVGVCLRYRSHYSLALHIHIRAGISWLSPTPRYIVKSLPQDLRLLADH